jgi:hypothetical protein
VHNFILLTKLTSDTCDVVCKDVVLCAVSARGNVWWCIVVSYVVVASWRRDLS